MQEITDHTRVFPNGWQLSNQSMLSHLIETIPIVYQYLNILKLNRKLNICAVSCNQFAKPINHNQLRNNHFKKFGRSSQIQVGCTRVSWTDSPEYTEAAMCSLSVLYWNHLLSKIGILLHILIPLSNFIHPIQKQRIDLKAWWREGMIKELIVQSSKLGRHMKTNFCPEKKHKKINIMDSSINDHK